MLSRYRLIVMFALLSFWVPVATAEQPPQSGQLLWSLQMGAPLWGGIVVDDGTAYFGSDDGHVYAVDIAAQALRWKFATAGKVRSAPALHDAALFVASDDGHLYKLQADTGERIWAVEIGTADHERSLPAKSANSAFDWSQSSPVVNNGVVYVGSGDGALYAFDANRKRLIWRAASEGPVRGAPAIGDNSVYFGSWDSHLYAVDKATGKQLWRQDLGGPAVSSPLLKDDLVIVGSRGARLFALEPQSGEVAWDVPFAGGSWVESSAAAGEGNALYVGSSDARQLLKLNSRTGATEWSVPTGGWSWATPLVGDGVVYVGALGLKEHWQPVDGGLFAVGTAKGDIHWHHEAADVAGYINSGFVSTPTLVDHRLLVGGVDGRFYVFAR